MSKDYIKYGRSVVESEISSLRRLSDSLDDSLLESLKLMNECKGRVVISGMGKSGLIGKKISATLSSTGTPSFFLHPAEALHGDLGMIREEDVFLSISNSGSSDEILRIIPFIRKYKIPHITMTGKKDSLVASHADVVLDISIDKEACPLQLAPMSSTTLTLVMGDVLAASLMEMKNFQPENFALFHPAGALGRKLLTTVADEMRKENLPVVSSNSDMNEVIYTIYHGQLGLAIVLDGNKGILGLITDGDLRRALESKKEQIFSLVAQDIMTKQPTSVDVETSISDVESVLKEKKIKAVLVTEENHLVGVFEYNGVL